MDTSSCARIRAILHDVANLKVDVRQLSDYDDLFDAGLSSLSIVSLMLGLEDEFTIEFTHASLHSRDFRTITSIERVVEQSLSQSHHSATGVEQGGLR